jgi:hypothetical protein
MFFFEKKNQKTFIRLAPRKLKRQTSGDEGAGAKVFLLLFFKKAVFSSSATGRA